MSIQDLPDNLSHYILDALPIGIFLVCQQGKIAFANPKAEEIFGFGKGELLNYAVDDFVPENYRASHKSKRERYFAAPKSVPMADGRVLSAVKKNGDIIQLQIGLTPIENGSIMLTFIESTNQVIKPMNANDSLTGLPNRNAFNDVCKKLLEYAKRHKTDISILVIDLDNFKNVNDHFGHLVGDRLLCEAATKMKAKIRASDILARMGGDEFIACMTNVGSLENLQNTANGLIKAVMEAQSPEHKQIKIHASIGAVFAKNVPAIEMQALCDQADKLMYQAKLAGKAIAIVDNFSPP